MNDWDEKITKSLDEIKNNDSIGFLNLISIAIHNRLNCESSTNVDKLYNIIGYDNFVKVIKKMGGRKVVIPKEDDFQETLMVVIIYYYKEIKHLSWEEISSMFPYENIAKVYPKKINSLNKTIKEQLIKIMEE